MPVAARLTGWASAPHPAPSPCCLPVSRQRPLVLLSRVGPEGIAWRRGAAAPLEAAGLPRGWTETLAVHVSRASASGTAGEVVSVPVVVPERTIEQVVVLGVGAGSDGELRRAGAALVAAATRGDVVVVGLGRAGGPAVRAFVEGIGLGRYAFRRPAAPDWPDGHAGRPRGSSCRSSRGGDHRRRRTAGPRPHQHPVLDEVAAVAGGAGPVGGAPRGAGDRGP